MFVCRGKTYQKSQHHNKHKILKSRSSRGENIANRRYHKEITAESEKPEDRLASKFVGEAIVEPAAENFTETVH